MSRNYSEASKKQKTNPYNPIIGFIILGVLGALTYFASEPAWEFITTTPYSLPFFGQVLPLDFPTNWPNELQQLVVGGFIFLTFFIFFTAIAIAFAPSPQKKDEAYVDIREIRKEREERDKAREKAARKAARRRRR